MDGKLNRDLKSDLYATCPDRRKRRLQEFEIELTGPSRLFCVRFPRNFV